MIFYGCAFDLYGSKFSHLLAARAEGADLSTSLLTVKADCKKKHFLRPMFLLGNTRKTPFLLQIGNKRIEVVFAFAESLPTSATLNSANSVNSVQAVYKALLLPSLMVFFTYILS